MVGSRHLRQLPLWFVQLTFINREPSNKTCSWDVFQGALFASAEATLIPFVKTASVDSQGNPSLTDHAGLFKCLLVLSYGAFLFTGASTISSLFLIDKLGEMAFLNRNRVEDVHQVPRFVASLGTAVRTNSQPLFGLALLVDS